MVSHNDIHSDTGWVEVVNAIRKRIRKLQRRYQRQLLPEKERYWRYLVDEQIPKFFQEDIDAFCHGGIRRARDRARPWVSRPMLKIEQEGCDNFDDIVRAYEEDR